MHSLDRHPVISPPISSFGGNDVLSIHSSSQPKPHSQKQTQSWRRRDAPLDPLLFTAAIAANPNVTRHHYHHHDFLPATLGIVDADGDGEIDWMGIRIEDIDMDPPPRYVSRQAPRSQRLLGETGKIDMRLRNGNVDDISKTNNSDEISINEKPRTIQIHADDAQCTTTTKIPAFTPPPFDTMDVVQVQCLSRARIPTPHGPVFLHLYRNNRDNKEHLAIVVDPTQLLDAGVTTSAAASAAPQLPLLPPIRSRTLDAVWSPLETETDRIVRGAYVGRLTPMTTTTTTTVHTATPEVLVRVEKPDHDAVSVAATAAAPSPSSVPLVRIHSECFTGETIGSMRCDCGEQLDEALRLISLPTITTRANTAADNNDNTATTTTIPGRGVIVYMRQEGRGIGLLSKLRAYNLQDMGHDTVTANLMLGHGADERGYEAAAAILKDLGMDGVRLLTNNPEKVRALEREGVKIVERVGMVPRSWRCRQQGKDDDDIGVRAHKGVTMIGAGTARGKELDKYLRAKVDRMGHMLVIPN